MTARSFARTVTFVAATVPVMLVVNARNDRSRVLGSTPSTAVPGRVAKERVTFVSDGRKLVGFVFKPEGSGPFPTVVWNHGSEQTPDKGVQFDSVAAVFVPAGYAVFAPVRRGHGDSEGPYVVDSVQRIMAAHGAEAANKLTVKLLSDQLDDVLAGVAYIKTQTFVDSSRMAVVGCSYGGIETLLVAERGAGFKAAIAISPAALSWRGNAFLRTRLKDAIANINMPVMLMQPPKDATLEPIKVLGAEFSRLKKPYVAKIFPENGPEELQQHCFGGAKGMHVWAKDATDFLKASIK